MDSDHLSLYSWHAWWWHFRLVTSAKKLWIFYLSCKVLLPYCTWNLTTEYFKFDGNSIGGRVIIAFLGKPSLWRPTCCECSIACSMLHICFSYFMHIFPSDLPKLQHIALHVSCWFVQKQAMRSILRKTELSFGLSILHFTSLLDGLCLHQEIQAFPGTSKTFVKLLEQSQTLFGTFYVSKVAPGNGWVHLHHRPFQ